MYTYMNTYIFIHINMYRTELIERTYVYIYIICTDAYIHMYIFTYVYIYIYIHTHVCVYMSVSVSAFASTSVRMMCVDICIYSTYTVPIITCVMYVHICDVCTYLYIQYTLCL